MRSIIRFSVNGETDGALRNKLAGILEGAGYVRNSGSTATYEAHNITEANLATAMQNFWQAASSPPQGVSIDHVWTYADNPGEESAALSE